MAIADAVFIEGWADRLERDEVRIDAYENEVVVWDTKRQDVWGYEITEESDGSLR